MRSTEVRRRRVSTKKSIKAGAHVMMIEKNTKKKKKKKNTGRTRTRDWAGYTRTPSSVCNVVVVVVVIIIIIIIIPLASLSLLSFFDVMMMMCVSNPRPRGGSTKTLNN